jgi:hypothetical protein
MLLALPALTGCAEPGTGDAAPPKPALPVCRDPCLLAIDPGPSRAWEPAVAVDPKDPAHIVVASTSLQADPTASTASPWLAAHVSSDGGRSWTKHEMPGGPGADPRHPLATATGLHDPALLFLKDVTLLYAGLASVPIVTEHGVAVESGGTIFVARSSDGGRTFPDIAIAARGEGIGASAEIPGAGPQYTGAAFRFHDNPWMALAPDGSVLLTMRRIWVGHPDGLDSDCEILFSSSSDGGRSWSAPRVVAAGNCVVGGYPAAGENGSWAVAYHGPGSLGGLAVWVATSKDHGATWDTTEVAPAAPRSLLPALAMARPPGNGSLWLAFESQGGDGEGSVPTLAWSGDGGRTWTLQAQLDASDGSTIPSMAVDDGGAVWITSFHQSGTGPSATSEYRAHRYAGSLSAPLVLDAGIEDDTARLGHYMGLASIPGGGAFAVWVAHRDGEFDIMGAAIGVP